MLTLLAMAAGNGGDYHNADTGQLMCSDCHQMHGSGAGNYDYLLKESDIEALCATCHGPGGVDAPDVYDPSYDAAGGAFAPSGQVIEENRHSIGTAATPPGGTTEMFLTCTSCHSPHGNSNFRNLLLDPPGEETADTLVRAHEIVTSPIEDRYSAANIEYISGMSAWCNDCHTNFHGLSSHETGFAEPWFRHPQDVSISGASRADFEHWGGAIAERVPVQSPTEEDPIVPSADDEVFCLSCHKAHGGGFVSMLRFPQDAMLVEVCQQCHNK